VFMMNPFRVPRGLPKLKTDRAFDPDRDLQLEEPEKVWNLTDFGYTREQQAKAPFPLAVTTPFRLLSDAGVEKLREIITELTSFRRQSERMANYIRGSLYYSEFLRGFCAHVDVNAFISKLAGREVRPHPMTLYQGHINLKPEDPKKEVDRWHTDTVLLDYVLMVTDPKSFKGGHFEYFQSTKAEAIRSLIKEDGLPNVVKVEFPKAGYALLQQGNKVVHRANRVEAGNERTTMVQSFLPGDSEFIDVSKLNDCKKVDPPEYLFTEWARYKGLMAAEKLQKLTESLPYTTDKGEISNQLRMAIRDVEEAIFELNDPSEGALVHFSDDPLTGLLPEG
ncbi:MAG: hypothetical protein AAF202_08905, partial [Pseudomonadota bacterium]